MRKTMIVIATAVLALGSTSLSTSASAFGLVHLGGFGLGHLGGVGLVRPDFRLAQPGVGLVHPGGGYGLGHLGGRFGGRGLGGESYRGGYDHDGGLFYRGYAYRAAPLSDDYDYGGQPYYGGGPYDGNGAYADAPYDSNNYTDGSTYGRRGRRGLTQR